MSQTYATLLGTDTLTASRTTLNNNLDALLSSFSGTAFPVSPVVGQSCLRTDQQKIYVCKSIGPAVWYLQTDLAATMLTQETADTRYINSTNGSFVTIQGTRARAQLFDMYDGTTATDKKTSRFMSAGGLTYFEAINDAYSTSLLTFFTANHTTGRLVFPYGIDSQGSIWTRAGGTSGATALYSGDTSNPGYVSFFNPAGTRVGYLGYSDGNNRLLLHAENGYTQWAFTQRPLFNGFTPFDSGNHSLFNGKNYLINGCFRVNQRSASGGVSSGGYLWDRWFVPNGSSFSVNASYVVTLNGTAIQHIETPGLAGKAVTISIEDPSANITVYVGTYDSSTLVNGVITAGSGRRSVTLTVPAGATGHVQLRLVTTASTTFKNVQLERGTVASEFEWRFFSQELSLCQRYYCGDTNNYHLFPAPNNTFADVYPVRFPVMMRVSPTLSIGYTATSSLSAYSILRVTPAHFDNLHTASANTNISAEFTYTATAEL